jgi:hypothetical protein
MYEDRHYSVRGVVLRCMRRGAKVYDERYNRV